MDGKVFGSIRGKRNALKYTTGGDRAQKGRRKGDEPGAREKNRKGGGKMGQELQCRGSFTEEPTEGERNYEKGRSYAHKGENDGGKKGNMVAGQLNLCRAGGKIKQKKSDHKRGHGKLSR